MEADSKALEETSTTYGEGQDERFPVWPVIIPNNCTYDPKTNKMHVDHQQKRDKLVPYKPVKQTHPLTIISHHNEINNHHITNHTKRHWILFVALNQKLQQYPLLVELEQVNH